MRTRFGLTLLLIVFAAWPLAAQICNGDEHPDERIIDCWNRLNPSPDTTAGEKATKDELAKANTGVTTMSSPLNTALRDFLALFSAAVSSSSLSQNGDNLTLDWNVSGGPLSGGNVVKIQALIANPVLNEALKTQLTGKSDAEAIGNSLNDFDDVQLSATYAPTTLKFGRAMEPHRLLLRAAMQAARKAAPQPEEFFDLLALLQKVQDKPPFNSGEPLNVKFSDITDPAVRARIEAVVAAAAVQEKSASTIVRAATDPFRKLLGNQPQLYGSVVGHARKNLVGADEIGARVTYERGGVSLKDFYTSPAGHECTPPALAALEAKSAAFRACGERLESFAKATEVQQALASASRIAFSLEYDQTSGNSISLPQDKISITTPHSHKTVGSLVWGMVLTRDAQNRDGRIDVNVSYENYSNDPSKKNRAIGSAVYTQKLTDTLTLPIGFVYASHANDVMNVDKRLSVHLGLVYKLSGGG